MEELKQAILASADPSSPAAKNPPGVEAIYKAVVEEVKWRRNWTNAWQLFDMFLCPVILASTPSSQADNDDDKENNQGNNNNNNNNKLALNRELSAQENQWIQWAISALVRYAPNPQEANRVYMFFLQRCRPPLRDDQTINHCLVSLIYQYAQVKGNNALMAQGLDLIQVALDRGVGLPTYEVIQSTSKQKKRMAYERLQQQKGNAINTSPPKNSILASVSRPILRYHHLAISDDGRSLIEFPHSRPPPSHQPHFQLRQQQQQQQQQQPAPATHENQPAPSKHPKKTKRKPHAVANADVPSTSSAAAAAAAAAAAPSAADTAAAPAPTSKQSSQPSLSPSSASSSSPSSSKRHPQPIAKATPRPVSRHPHHFVYSDEPSEPRKNTKGKAPPSTVVDDEPTLEELASLPARGHADQSEVRKPLSGMSGRPKKHLTGFAAESKSPRKLPQIKFVPASSLTATAAKSPQQTLQDNDNNNNNNDDDDDGNSDKAAVSSHDEEIVVADKMPSRSGSDGDVAKPETTTTTTTKNEEEALSEQMKSMGLSESSVDQASCALSSPQTGG
ncbi:hypothetical protein BGW42_003582 [Actinomortierella wolfii]|nr:hypothetical protein BGW42_003582 [Actinomortierella wolfii]